MDHDDDGRPVIPLGVDPEASRKIFLGMLALFASGALAFAWFRPRPGPPPAAISGNAQLVRGREIYLDRCAGCHGAGGRGDGPTAPSLRGPPPGNLTDESWKHGDRPEEVEQVVAAGVRDTAMPAWAAILDPRGVRDVLAYVYYLAGRPVPVSLRAP